MTMNIAIIVSTHSRLDDARINLELIDRDWKQSGRFNSIRIVHTYNGDPAWYTKTLEDELIIIPNSGHFQGACELIDAGIAALQPSPDLDYVICLTADAWLMNPHYVADRLDKMRAENRHLAAAARGSTGRNELLDVGMTTDCFIVDWPFVQRYGMFPIDYAGFRAKYEDWSLYEFSWMISVEKLVLSRFARAVKNSMVIASELHAALDEHILRLTEREPIHIGVLNADRIAVRQNQWPSMGLTTDHDVQAKRAFALQSPAIGGPVLAHLRESEDLGWYNRR